MNETTLALSCGVVIVLLLMIVAWKWRRDYKLMQKEEKGQETTCTQSAQLVHKLCPHNNVLQSFAVVEKDSLDAHLDLLTKKLAEKEGRLRLSKSKIRETQNEIQNLQAIDHNVRLKYREIMDNLKRDLLCNEQECMKLHDQIEWVSERRAELREEMRRGQQLYGAAAEELANNLTELQRGRGNVVVGKPTPRLYSNTSLRHRKEPVLPRSTLENKMKTSPTPESLGPIPSYDPEYHR